MSRPRVRVSVSASSNDSAPAATHAEYSPRLCPATNAGVRPVASTSLSAATLCVSSAGCVFTLFFNSSAGPFQHRFESAKPSTRSAVANASSASGNASASALPMPTA